MDFEPMGAFENTTEEFYQLLDDIPFNATSFLESLSLEDFHCIVSWISTFVLAPPVILLLLPFIFYFYFLSVIFYSNLVALVRPLFYKLSDEEYLAGARSIVHQYAKLYGKVLHGVEFVNTDVIPKDGPALLLNYHGGAVPIDSFLMQSKLNLDHQRMMHCVVDKFFFERAPGFKYAAKLFGLLPGTVDSCSELLNEGNLLMVYPGGAREGFFTDDQYTLVWGKRKGFAKIAQQSKAPIIPVFAENCREAFKSVVSKDKNIFSWFYEKTKLPFVPIYGGLPVKIRIYFGEPIHYDPNLSVEDISAKVQSRLREMIVKNQKLPGSMPQALLDRFR